MLNQPKILAVGLNHKIASVEMRENLVGKNPFEQVTLDMLQGLISEFVGISTCNRTEAYVVTTNPSETARALNQIFDQQYIYTLIDEEATRHLYRVVAGLDSMVLGEYDIVAQVKQAYLMACKENTVGPMLHQLFQRAIRASKVVRSSTQIGAGITSMARAAVEHAKLTVTDFTAQPVLIVGAGDMADKMGKYLRKEGIGDITFTNRTYDRAAALAQRHHGVAVNFDSLTKAVAASSVIFCATSSPGHVISAAQVATSMAGPELRAKHFIDLAIPRDVDPAAGKISGVYLHNVDTLQGRLDELKQVRIESMAAADALIEIESKKFWDWQAARPARALHGQESESRYAYS